MALNKRQKTSLTLDRRLYAGARKIAEEDRREIAGVIEIALEEYIAKWKRNRKQAMRLQEVEA